MVMELKAMKRDTLGKGVRMLRKGGDMPAVVYGPKQETLAISVSQREFEKVFKSAGESTVVSIMVDGEAIPTLIHEVDHDPVTQEARHADFYAIVKGQKVEVNIPLEFEGESGAIKAGANLVKTLHEVEVKADPMNLPHELVVDISALENVGDQILASAIKLPAGVELVTDPEEVVAIAAEAKEEELEVAPTDVDMSQIADSVEKGKAEDADASQEEAKAE